MKIGIMADSHDNLPAIAAAVGLLAARGTEVLIHAGDFVSPFAVKEILRFPGEIYGVFGNNDGEVRGIEKIWGHVYFAPVLLELGGVRIVVSHREKDLSRAPWENIDVRIFGHTHKAEIRKGAPLEINPGETGGWLTGRRTLAILETEGLSAEILEIE